MGRPGKEDGGGRGPSVMQTCGFQMRMSALLALGHPVKAAQHELEQLRGFREQLRHSIPLISRRRPWRHEVEPAPISKDGELVDDKMAVCFRRSANADSTSRRLASKRLVRLPFQARLYLSATTR